MDSTLRDKYFRTLGTGSFPPEEKNEMLKAALRRAYELRSFEIDHYWKRATYFWGFQVAIFAAFGLLWKSGSVGADVGWDPVTVALAGLGFLTAVANSCSSRGSKFWQRNWEYHIDMLEDRLEGRLHKIVWLEDGHFSFSVSRIQQTLSDCFVIFWFLVMVYTVCKFIGVSASSFPNARELYIVAFLIAIAFGRFKISSQRSRLEGSLPEPDGSHGKRPFQPPLGRAGFLTGSASIKASPADFIRRYAPDELP